MSAGRTPSPPPYGTIVFDCDSTLCSIEGIEALGEGLSAEVAALTERAMEGTLPLEEVYGARLELIRPTREAVERIGRLYCEATLPHARELLAALLALGKRVLILSGGLAPAVRILGEELGVKAQDVHAVEIHFDGEGNYAGFDERSPLARSGGKPALLAELLDLGAATAPLSLVGDGATDLEAAPLCARFIAFGGVVRRRAVFAAADATFEAADLAGLLPLLTSAEERATLAADPLHAALLGAAEPFLTPPGKSPR